MTKIRSMSEIILSYGDKISILLAKKRVPNANRIYDEVVFYIQDYKGEIPAETIERFCQRVAQAHIKHNGYRPALKVLDWGIMTLEGWSSAEEWPERLKVRKKQISLEKSQRAKALQSQPKEVQKKKERTKPKPFENQALLQRLKVAQDRHSQKLMSGPHHLSESLFIESPFPMMDVEHDPERRALSSRFNDGWQ
ncbi:hypothetical protein BH10CYA1_BH10CYA1_62150 [soil metagenome]